MPVYPIPLSGESRPNDDGSSRQRELARCRPAEPVKLERQPDNPHDTNAIFVRSVRGVGIGFIARDYNDWIAERIDKGHPVSACIKSLHAAGSKQLIGCVLNVASAGEDPAEGIKQSGGLLGWLEKAFRTSS